MLNTCLCKPSYWNYSPDGIHRCDAANKPQPAKCINQTLDTSLQDDLEVSDSDDEPVITEVRSGNSATFKESPLNASHSVATASTKVMDEPEHVPSNSSSSESGDSDSNDSSSESNDSDSSASSEASDADTPSKMWGLSNFFDESRRNHSPAFVPMDTSTNSSTAAVKEDPVVTPSNPKESYSLIDDDLGSNIIHNPVPDPIPKFLALNTPVNIKSEILSPITSPVPQSSGQPPIIRGPRTPPLPAYSKDDVAESETGLSSKIVHDESFTLELRSQNSKLSSALHNVCDKKDDVGKVQITGAKKQRLSKNKCDTISPKSLTSPSKQSHQDIEPSASKGLCDPVLSEDEIDAMKCAMPSSCSVPSETAESSHENYPIKTRQKLTKSSNSKLNSVNNESFGGSGQKETSSKPNAEPKFKTPLRTCRASTETKQSSKSHKSSKVNQTEDKKPVNKSDSKDKLSQEKSKLSKPVKNVKGVSKNSQKVKKNLSKSVSKHSVDSKKNELKKKRNKFHIANFLQSPTGSQNETAQTAALSSPSPEKSPMPTDYTFDAKRKSSISPHRSSSNIVKVNQKSPEKARNSSEKLRRSTRCSDRLSASRESESSSISQQQHSDLNKKPGKRTPKLKGILPELEDPPKLLSPIPLTSPKPSVLSGCAIPSKIMVCIPLGKLSRLPLPVHGLDTDSKSAGKSRSHFVNTSVPRKDELSSDKEQKSDTNKSSVVKDIKDKPRTDLADKSSKSKSAKTSRKEKNKQIEPVEPVKNKSSSPVNSKTSIKSKSPRSIDEPADLKKRKGDEDKHAKKKMKTYSEPAPESQHSVVVPGSPGILPELSTKTKSLERCDSLSSLSSLSSQISQKSSKGKRSSSTSDSKKGKTTSLSKHIKQEKEEKLKPVIKKEPPSPEKVKERCKDDVCPSDMDVKPSVDHLHLPSSQQLPYFHWDVSNKGDLKGFLPLNTSHCVTRDLDWDHFPEMNKEMKKASNKHNDTIMPMDYYYTEGRKQKQLAEREKDPFLQAIKFFEATVLFILTSQQREEYTKELDSVYQFYRETLNFSNVILQNAHIQHSLPGSTEFKVLILLLRCQALLHVKLYSLKIKEIKEQQKAVSDFFMTHCSATVKSLSHPTPLHPRLNLMSVPSSPHSPPQSPASSINSQTSGYCSSDLNGNHMKNVLSLSQHMLEMICRQHTHLINLHMGHDLWEQADMYMTRSNLREFFKEVADLSETLTLHSSIKDLVSYIQTGISLVKKYSR